MSYYTFALLTASLFFNQSESAITLLHCLHVQENMLQHYLAFIALLLIKSDVYSDRFHSCWQMFQSYSGNLPGTVI